MHLILVVFGNLCRTPGAKMTKRTLQLVYIMTEPNDERP